MQQLCGTALCHPLVLFQPAGTPVKFGKLFLD